MDALFHLREWVKLERLVVVMMDSCLPVIRALFAVFWAEVVSRTTGPLALRFLLEPFMAAALAICDGMRNARSKRFLPGAAKDQKPFLEGTSIASRVFFIVIGMDVIYHYVVLTAVRPLQAVTVGFLLACISYVLVRGRAARIGWWQQPAQDGKMASLMRRSFAIGGRSQRQRQ
jgi:hypothetical protein